MIYLIIGVILAIVAYSLVTREKKDAIVYLAVLGLGYIALTFIYQDLYFDFVVRNNIKMFYNGGYGITYNNVVTLANNTTVTTPHYYYGATDNITGEYFARVDAERNIMAILSNNFAYFSPLFVILIFWLSYKKILRINDVPKREVK